MDCKGIKSVNPKGNQSILIGRTDDEAEMPILWPSDAKNWLIGKASDVGKDWRQDEKGMAEDEIVGWHNRLDGHKFEQALGVGRWTGKPGVLQSMGSQRVVHDWATDLNWTEFWKEYLMLTSYLSLIEGIHGNVSYLGDVTYWDHFLYHGVKVSSGFYIWKLSIAR